MCNIYSDKLHCREILEINQQR